MKSRDDLCNGEKKIETFLTFLAREKKVAPSTQNQAPLETHLEHVRIVHEGDIANGYGEVYLPHALARKYPNSARQWQWQYVFPAQGLSTDPRTGIVCRHHLDPSPINKAIANAVRTAGVRKRVSAHTFRHSFATDLLRLY